MNEAEKTKKGLIGAELELMYALKNYIILRRGKAHFEKTFPYDANMMELLTEARETFFNTLEPWPDTSITKLRTEEEIT